MDTGPDFHLPHLAPPMNFYSKELLFVFVTWKNNARCFIKGRSCFPPTKESFHLLGERRGSLRMREGPPRASSQLWALGRAPSGRGQGWLHGQQQWEFRGATRGGEARRRRSQREEGGRERKQQREEQRDAPGNWWLQGWALQPTPACSAPSARPKPAQPTISSLLVCSEYRWWQTLQHRQRVKTSPSAECPVHRAEGKFSMTGHLNHWDSPFPQAQGWFILVMIKLRPCKNQKGPVNQRVHHVQGNFQVKYI